MKVPRRSPGCSSKQTYRQPRLPRITRIPIATKNTIVPTVPASWRTLLASVFSVVAVKTEDLPRWARPNGAITGQLHNRFDRQALRGRRAPRGYDVNEISTSREGGAPAEPQALLGFAKRLRFGRSLTLPSRQMHRYSPSFDTLRLKNRHGAAHGGGGDCLPHQTMSAPSFPNLTSITINLRPSSLRSPPEIPP